ncbi:hypothetical protein J6590_073353 [Homalodisca vitripennis]|nr:hypothetical protein J6590_073353 [Homalodisca vitripennis]
MALSPSFGNSDFRLKCSVPDVARGILRTAILRVPALGDYGVFCESGRCYAGYLSRDSSPRSAQFLPFHFWFFGTVSN